MILAARTYRLLTFALALTALGIAGTRAQDRLPEPPFVAVITVSNSAAVQAVIDGMRDQLAERSRWPGETIRIEVAETGADTERAADRILKFDRDGANVLVAINGPAVAAAVSANTRVPLVVADVSLEMAETYKREHRRRSFTGVVFGATHPEQFALIRKLVPGVETLAIPIDPVDGNMQERLQTLRRAARQDGLDLMALPVSVIQNAVSNRISKLAPTTSAIMLDRTLLPVAPVEALAAAAGQRGLPLFATDEESVIRGALAAMVVEPFGVGEQVGNLVARILHEPAAKRAPFDRARATHLVINQDARAQFDLAEIEREIAATHRSVVDWAEVTGPRPRIKPTAPAPPPSLGVARGIEVPIPRTKPSPPS